MAEGPARAFGAMRRGPIRQAAARERALHMVRSSEEERGGCPDGDPDFGYGTPRNDRNGHRSKAAAAATRFRRRGRLPAAAIPCCNRRCSNPEAWNGRARARSRHDGCRRCRADCRRRPASASRRKRRPPSRPGRIAARECRLRRARPPILACAPPCANATSGKTDTTRVIGAEQSRRAAKRGGLPSLLFSHRFCRNRHPLSVRCFMPPGGARARRPCGRPILPCRHRPPADPA